MSVQNTLEKIALELSRALSPLQSLTGSLDEFTNFLLTELGWDVNDIPQPVRDLASDIARLVTLTKDISDTDKIDYSKLAEITAALVELIDNVRKTAQGSNAGLLPSLIAEQFLEKLPDELLQYLLVEYLRGYHPFGYAALQLLGITALEQVVDITPARPPHVKRKINWPHFIDILTKPQKVFENVYGWGSLDFDFLQLAYNLADFFNPLGFSTYLVQMDNAVARVLEEKQDLETNLIKYYLKMPFALSGDNALNADFGIGLFPLPQANALNPGFAVLPYGNGNANVSGSVKITDHISFAFETALKLADGVGLVVRPDQDIKIFTGFQGGNGAGAATGALKVGLLFTSSNNSAIRLITVSDTKYVEMQGAGVYAGADLLTSDRKDLFAELELRGGKLAIGTDGTDGFLSTVLPAQGINANFDLALGISTLRGVYFRGSGGLEIQLPTHVQLGPIELQSVTISIPVTPNGSAIPLGAGASVKLALGPMQAVVENIGLRANLSLPGAGGNLGPIDLTLGFKPPKGVGLSIDAGVVKGGGYLYLDYEKGEYAGALELVFAGWINVKAIGLINTKMPDGSKGFSLLIIITAEFGSGLQLGFGFVLLGVGGLLGLNRTMRLQPLMEGVRSGAINGIMFPKDVVANAPRIISDLRTIFPPESGKFLIGPMAKLGWGTPALISVSLGIIIEIPGNIAILGVLKVALPAEQAPLLVLQVNFAGAIEFDKKRLYFFASLFESRVLFITIDGEMGLLVAWGADANFVLAVGGFHPRFTPPPLPFPSPKRIAMDLANYPGYRISVMGYFAVTSNTVQFGARAEMYFGFSCCNLSGFMAFDALIQFSPFYFIVQISAELSLKVFGIGLFSVRLRFSLEGPTPWRAKGSFSFSIFWIIEISIDFDYTWGESHDTSLPPIEVMPLLEAELKKLSNWSAQMPASASGLLVSLRPPAATTSEVVLHPAGTLRVSQRAVPLDVTIAKVGNQKAGDANHFTLSASGDLTRVDDAIESFAMGQFLELDNSAKLTRKAFEGQHAGLVLSAQGDQLASSRMAKRVIRYETVIIDSNYKRLVLHLFTFWKGLFAHFLGGNAVSKSALSAAQKKQFQPFADKIAVTPDEYTVAFTSTNGAYRPEAAAFASEALAHEYLRAQVQGDPALAEQLHVIPRAEVNGSV